MSRTEPAVIVVSGLTVPKAPQSLQRSGMRNRTGLVGTFDRRAFGIPEWALLKS
jgi:hypothetical protein